jgi:serine/threonine protein kinase
MREVKVLDFGIAKVIADAAAKGTASLGTPMWMAPEQ